MRNDECLTVPKEDLNTNLKSSPSYPRQLVLHGPCHGTSHGRGNLQSRGPEGGVEVVRHRLDRIASCDRHKHCPFVLIAVVAADVLVTVADNYVER